MERWLDEVRARALPGGGFADRRGGRYRPDATAWAIIALSVGRQGDGGLLDEARLRLAQDQLADGRVSISRDHPEVIWPTSLAILAWQRAPACRALLSKATTFLAGAHGLHWNRPPRAPIAHDTAILGWPWVSGAHSWVEPTGLAITALRTAGMSDHPRVREGIRLLLDRQLPSGGWNYGNTLVFNHEQWPCPECTGVVLQALVGLVPRAQIQRSLDYLSNHIGQLRTPLSLGWSLLGVSSWDDYPREADGWVKTTLEREARYGGYDTPALCLLLRAGLAPGGLARPT